MEAYNDICAATSDDNKESWLEVEADAQAQRWDDKTVMDVYDVEENKGLWNVNSILHRV